MSFEDQWVEVNKVPTRILSWGKSPTQDLTGVQELFLCISGNPGVTLYYVTFLEELHNRTKVPVWMISHAGHELPPSRHEPQLSLPPLSDKSNEALYNLSGQTQHKLTFIQSHIPSQSTLEQHASKFRIYFGAKDYWCPVSFYSNLTQKCPSIRTHVISRKVLTSTP
ncbi:lipid droplet-associated hydrolase-like [Diaphorina citri]|uniref:Lipid droplet-associated hydrolase-like n=1 Tax=Diaphorina citri TaxID=121845 RepID=A0A1S3D1N6_DIACI|nr:lipid droplet-associated hydrolase-like [Diaphorina citri]